MIGRIALPLMLAVLLAGASHAAPPDPPRYSAATLYNLANSYARAGKPGLAALNYERAWLLAPGDQDIEANLRYVRAAAHLPTVPATWQDRVAAVANPAPVAWLGLGGLLLVTAALLAADVSRRLRRTLLVAGSVAVGFTAVDAWAFWPHLHAAVVVSAGAPARVAPVPMGDPLFTLTEADTVLIRAQHDHYLLVKTRDGRAGWVSQADLVPVVP